MGELTGLDVSVRIMGDGLDPGLVTEKLGIAPDRAHKKGDVVVRGRGKPVGPWRTGVWIYHSDLPSTARLEDHFQAVLALFEPKAGIIQELKDAGCTVEFYCGLFLAEWNQGTMVSASPLGRIAALGADLSLDLYYTPEEESQKL